MESAIDFYFSSTIDVVSIVVKIVLLAYHISIKRFTLFGYIWNSLWKFCGIKYL